MAALVSETTNVSDSSTSLSSVMEKVTVLLVSLGWKVNTPFVPV